MISRLLEIYRLQQWSLTTAVYLLRKFKLSNSVSLITIFCVILIPVTLVSISNSILHIVQKETSPYSYFIFKTDALKKDIESFVGIANELGEIKVEILSPETLKNQFFESLGIYSVDSALVFPYAAQVTYPPNIVLEDFKSNHELMSNRQVIKSAESNHQLITRARIVEKVAIGFMVITFFIINIFCTLVSFVSSKNALFLYSTEIKGLILSGLTLNTIRRPIILCSVINGILLGVCLYSASIFLAAKSNYFINEYLFLPNQKLSDEGYSESPLVFLVLMTTLSFILGSIIASKQIKAKIVIE